MHRHDLTSLKKQLNKIIAEEIRKALRAGPTDRETVAQSVEKRATILMKKLALQLAAEELREMIRRMLKKVQFDPGKAGQMEFAAMDEFRGIPPNVTYEDKPGHVAYICYLDTTETQRTAALALLAKSMAADQQTYRALESGNDFASELVKQYGDLPLRDLYRRYKDDHGQAAGGGRA